jgi:hypothetical protein
MGIVARAATVIVFVLAVALVLKGRGFSRAVLTHLNSGL